MNVEEKNVEYKKAVADEIAKTMRENGYSVSNGKLLGGAIGVIFALIAIIYTSLLTADKTQASSIEGVKADVTGLRQELATLRSQIQNMAGNIYILCQNTDSTKCVKPDVLIK